MPSRAINRSVAVRQSSFLNVDARRRETAALRDTKHPQLEKNGRFWGPGPKYFVVRFVDQWFNPGAAKSPGDNRAHRLMVNKYRHKYHLVNLFFGIPSKRAHSIVKIGWRVQRIRS